MIKITTQTILWSAKKVKIFLRCDIEFSLLYDFKIVVDINLQNFLQQILNFLTLSLNILIFYRLKVFFQSKDDVI
jgi:hypothetical protein